MPLPILHTERLLLVPLANRHLELEVELDSDPEVLRYLSGRANTRDEVIESHARRMAHARKGLVVGTPGQVRAQLEALAAEYAVDEAMVLTITEDYATRLRSYELVAQAFGLS